MTAGYLNRNNTITYCAEDLGSTIASGSTYKVVNRNSGLVLGVRDASKTAGADLLQWNDTNAGDHRWTFERQSSGCWRFRNTNSGPVAGITNQSTANGAVSAQWADNGPPTTTG